MHSEQFDGINVCKDINMELLPIFIELLHGYYNNMDQLIYKLQLLPTYIDLYMMVTEDKKRDLIKKYLSSTLKAINLYSLYIDNSNTGKEIIDDINKVFICRKTLEELLIKYQISLDSFKPSLKSLIKLGNR